MPNLREKREKKRKKEKKKRKKGKKREKKGKKKHVLENRTSFLAAKSENLPKFFFRKKKLKFAEISEKLF